MMHQKELLLSESVAEQCAECMGHSSWIAEIGLSQRASWLLGLSKLITNSLISSPVCAFLHLSYNLVKVLGLLLPSESSAWLLSRKQCRARFHRGCSGVCVCMYCVSLSVLGLPQKMTFGMICTTQLQSPQCRCWKSTLSVLWRLQPPQWIMQFTNTLENAQHATEQLLTLYKASAAPGARTGRDVWHWVGMSGTESVFAELSQTLLFGLKYLPLRLRLQRCEGRKEHHDGPRGG